MEEIALRTQISSEVSLKSAGFWATRCATKLIWPAHGVATLNALAVLLNSSTRCLLNSLCGFLNPARLATRPSILIGTRPNVASTCGSDAFTSCRGSRCKLPFHSHAGIILVEVER